MYLPNNLHHLQDVTGSIFEWSATGLNLEFYFSWTGCYTKVKELTLSYYLPIAWAKIVGFIPFARVLGLCENANSLIQGLNSGHYDCNHYAMSVYKYNN